MISSFVNASPNRKLLGYGYGEQMKDILPSLLSSLFMCAAVLLMGRLPLSPLPLLLVQVLTGVILYVGLALITRSDSLPYLVTTLRRLLGKNA